MPDPETTEQGPLEPETEATEEVESPTDFFKSTSEEPAPESQPEGEPSEPTNGGKVPEDMAARLAERDRDVALAKQEAAKFRHEAELYKSLAETGGATPGYPSDFAVPGMGPGPYTGGPLPYGYGHLQRPPVAPQIPPFDPKQVVTQEEYLMDPVASAYKIQEAKAEYDRRVAFVQRQHFESRTAPQAFASGRTAAMKAVPKLFEGIEVQVSQLVKESYDAKAISAEMMRDPKTWMTAAELYRREQGEQDFGKYYKAPPKGMAAVQTERPGATRTAKAGPTLTPEQEAMVAQWGMPKDKFLKAYEREIG